MNKTIKIDILNEKVIQLLQNLESMKLIKLHLGEKTTSKKEVDYISKFKGSLSQQSLSDVDQQLYEIRKSWN